MLMPEEELKELDVPKLVESLIKAVELDTKDSGNGNSPFDQNQLKEEILSRFESLERRLRVYCYDDGSGMIGEP